MEISAAPPPPPAVLNPLPLTYPTHAPIVDRRPPPFAVALYVGDLRPDVTENNLYDLFHHAGLNGLKSVRVCRDSSTGKSLGYGYVNFLTSGQAQEAIKRFNHTLLNGKSLRIMLSCRDSNARRSGIGNVFVKNLVGTIDNMKLHEIFIEFGSILSCKVATFYDGTSKGYGFIQFDSQKSADSSIEKLNGATIDGKQIYVGHFIRKSERPMAGPDFKYSNVYMKNLDDDITQELLHLKFSQFGKITSMAIAKDDEGKSKGFAFVNFEKHEDAKNAVEKMNGMHLGTKTLYVARAQKKAERQNYLHYLFEERRNEIIKKNASNVYVKNIDEGVDDDILKDHFSRYGIITSAKIMRNEKGVSKGYGFVCFSTREEANQSIRALHGYMLHGKPLYVALAQRKEERKAQLQMWFAQRAASLEASSNVIIPHGYPIYYTIPTGFAPPISHSHGFLYYPSPISHEHGFLYYPPPISHEHGFLYYPPPISHEHVFLYYPQPISYEHGFLYYPPPISHEHGFLYYPPPISHEHGFLYHPPPMIPPCGMIGNSFPMQPFFQQVPFNGIFDMPRQQRQNSGWMNGYGYPSNN